MEFIDRNRHPEWLFVQRKTLLNGSMQHLAYVLPPLTLSKLYGQACDELEKAQYREDTAAIEFWNKRRLLLEKHLETNEEEQADLGKLMRHFRLGAQQLMVDYGMHDQWTRFKEPKLIVENRVRRHAYQHFNAPIGKRKMRERFVEIMDSLEPVISEEFDQIRPAVMKEIMPNTAL